MKGEKIKGRNFSKKRFFENFSKDLDKKKKAWYNFRE